MAGRDLKNCLHFGRKAGVDVELDGIEGLGVEIAIALTIHSVQIKCSITYRMYFSPARVRRGDLGL